MRKERLEKMVAAAKKTKFALPHNIKCSKPLLSNGKSAIPAESFLDKKFWLLLHKRVKTAVEI